jgi:hypothetical protein
MTGESVECYNCGRANPAWAQVCRSCGVPMRPGSGASAASGPIPRDRESLISIVAVLGAIAGAIVLGVFVSGLIPEAPVATATPTPVPSIAPLPSGSTTPASVAPSAASVEPTPSLIGTLRLGTGLNEAGRIRDRTRSFGPGMTFCHSRTLSEPFGVDAIQEEILRIEEDGSLTEVQPRLGSNLQVDPASRTAGYCAPGGTDALIEGWGVGDFMIRDYRNEEEPELIAQARFTLTR